MYSKEQLVRVTSFIFMGSTLIGINLTDYGLDEETVNTTLFTLVILASMGFDAIGYILRWLKGDVTLGGFKK